MNRSYDSEEYTGMLEPFMPLIFIDGKQQYNQRQGRPNPRDTNQFAKERQSRFNQLSNEQNQYILEVQNNSQERQNFVGNQNMSNSYYDMHPNAYNKPPMVKNLNLGNHNIPMNQPMIQQEMMNDNQFMQNNPYQMQQMYGADASFNKEYANANIVSGSSTDRYKSQNQGVYNYVSTGNQMNSNMPNSAYNSLPNGGMPDQNSLGGRLNINKEFVANPPTFHPYHHLQNSSQINSQNSISPGQNPYMMMQNPNILESQTKESMQALNEISSNQITPKVVNGKVINYEQQIPQQYQMTGSLEDSRDKTNAQRPFVYDNYREMEQRNSQWDRNQQTYDKNTFGSLQGSYANMQQYNKGSEMQDSRVNTLRDIQETTQKKYPEDKRTDNLANDQMLKEFAMYKNM